MRFPRAVTTCTCCALTLFVLHSAPARAADGDPRFTLRVGAMDIDTSNTLRADTGSTGFNRDVDLGDKTWEGRVDGLFRISDRQRLIFDYFKYDKGLHEILDETVNFAGSAVPAGSFLDGKLKYQVASLVYDYSVIDGDRFDLGLQLGAEYAKVESNAYADLGALYQGDVLNEKADGIAPVVGVRLTFSPTERWLINLQGQYLNTSWGNFDDYEGDLSRANAIVQYNVNRNFGVFVGYDWFKLDADKRGSNGVVGLKQEFKGPVVGVSLSF